MEFFKKYWIVIALAVIIFCLLRRKNLVGIANSSPAVFANPNGGGGIVPPSPNNQTMVA